MAWRLNEYEHELADTLALAPGCRRVRISHHLAHVCSAFHPSPFDDAAVMIIDGQGSRVADLTETWAGAADVPGDWCEVASFYRADRQRVACIGKQLWNRDEQQPVGLGMFYFLLTQTMFPGEGKVMGLAPHGKARALRLPPRDGQVTIPQRWRDLFAERGRFRYGGADDARFADIANLAAAGATGVRRGVAGGGALTCENEMGTDCWAEMHWGSACMLMARQKRASRCENVCPAAVA